MTKRRISDETLSELVELIYPIHYKWWSALENVLRFGALTRMQIAILWLVRCEGEYGRSMRRKDIQLFLAQWFEASNSNVTKALRSMSSAPLNLVKLQEHPRSGREKQVVLTSKGEQFFLRMLDHCRRFLEPIAAQISEDELQQGIHYLKHWLSVVEALSISTFPKSHVANKRGKLERRERNGVRATANGA